MWALINPSRSVPEEKEEDDSDHQRWNEFEWNKGQVRLEAFYGEDYQVGVT